MKLFEKIEDIDKKFPNAVITIGNFDGVHIGHQALFHEVMEKAVILGGTAIAMTFEPHPIRVLKNNGHPPLITPYTQKVELIAKTGIDVLICIPFTREFASITAKEFVLDILMNRIGIQAIVVGKDYTFGKNREGNLNLLKSYAEAYDFEVDVVDWIPISNNTPSRISSTQIRKLLIDGKVREAHKLLGRHYQVSGVVVPGRNRGGKLLGFPTANIKLREELFPKNGIYAVTVDCLGKRHQGVANIGYSPTFDDNELTVEVYILDFNKDLYGQSIVVKFIERIRDEIKFSGISELSHQIAQDVLKARDILS
ncbi:MAG: bifunctional riboflavin kinase/FAD synthetase [Desulfobacterales bacterium]|nr:bifunctional riboflavin kinase/FAD synthetase [Desulfobacterales bacterium]MDX2511697.1 bifunctional riboflavin kinase/FAD synthetase [Desulfobacterales bacterium]